MSRMRLALLVLLATMVLAAARTMVAQEPNVRGRVTTTDGRPIPDAEVLVQGTRLATTSGADIDVIGNMQDATTDAAGRFTLTAVRAGTAILRMRKAGYAPVTQSVRLDEWRGLLVKMHALPNTLTDAQVRDRSGFGGFDYLWQEASQRIAARGGRSAVVPREELAEFAGMSLEQALMHSRSAAFVAGDLQGAGQRVCVLMDGRWSIGPTSLSGFRADDVEFVEIYPPGTEFTGSVARNLTTVRCPAVRVTSGSRRGPFYVVIWGRTSQAAVTHAPAGAPARRAWPTARPREGRSRR